MFLSAPLSRCRDLEGAGAETSPCSLALFMLRVTRAWHSFTRSTVHLTLTLTTLVTLALAVATQSALGKILCSLCTDICPGLTFPVNMSCWCSFGPSAHYTAALPRAIPDQPSPQQRFSPRLSRVTGSADQEAQSRVARIVQTHATRHVRSLQEAADLAVTASGVCVCALCTVFVSHLL